LVTGDMEIICIGNELLIGKIANTNAQWMSKRATFLGITVRRITVVSDEVEEISSALLEAIERKPQFVIMTGGLGPTFDDKTLQGMSRALDRKLEVNENALRMVREKYESYFKRDRIEKSELTPPRVKMATIPEGTIPIPNPVGTAPAVQVETGATVIVSLPGVPSEMEAIFDQTVVPMLRKASSNISFYEKRIYLDGIFESSIAPIVDQVMQDNPSIYIKSHPRGIEKKPHLEIHFSLKAATSEKPGEKLEKAANQLARLVAQQGGRVFTET
jgi:nicotinamide-nucleotide amidase